MASDSVRLRCEAVGCVEADAGCSLGPLPQTIPGSTAEALRISRKITDFNANLTIFYHSGHLARARAYLSC